MRSNVSFFHKFIVAAFAIGTSITPCALPADMCGEAVLQLGWFGAKQGKSQHINIEDLIGDDFSVHKSWDQNVLVGVGYYLEGYELPEVRLQYGINAFYLASTQVSGDVTQEELFTNLSYRYSITNYPIYFAAKALVPVCGDNALVIDLGIGPNVICTSGFKERSLDGGITIPDPHVFSGKNTVAFSATVGLGWRINNAFCNYPLEIDYRFFYLGEGRFKKGNSELLNTLHTGNSYANALFLTIAL